MGNNASLVVAKVDHAQKTGVLAAQNLKLEKVCAAWACEYAW